MPDYKETTVAGNSWQRAYKVRVDNPLNGIPHITFFEETAINLTDKTITEHVATIGCDFDATNPLHTDIYTKLNELYVLLRQARDSGGI